MDDNIFPGDIVRGFAAQEAAPIPPHPAPDAVPQDEPRHPRRRWALLAAAAVPWLVLLVVLARPGPSDDGAAPSSTASPAPRAESATPTDPAIQPAAPPASVYGQSPAPLDRLRVVATIAARHALGAAGPQPSIDGLAPGPSTAYVEHVAVEAVAMPSPGMAVVTVVATVLTASGDHYDGAALVRLAVPLTFDGPTVHLGGAPWRLPSPTLSVQQPPTVPDLGDGVRAQVDEALAAAGYREVAELQVGRTDAWPVVATFSGIAPGSDRTAQTTVWLRQLGDRLVVAGQPTHDS